MSNVGETKIGLVLSEPEPTPSTSRRLFGLCSSKMKEKVKEINARIVRIVRGLVIILKLISG